MKLFVLILCLLLPIFVMLTSCGQTNPNSAEGREVKVDGGSYWGMTAVQLNSLLAYDGSLRVKNKDFLLVNVHVPYVGEIIGTDLLVPYDEIEQNLFRFPENKSDKIILYCYTGRMSISAAKVLVKHGFTNVWHLDQGMVVWEREGYGLYHGIY